MKGVHVRIVLALVLIAAALTPALAQAQDPAARGPGSPPELAAIQRSLDRLVELFESHLDYQRVDLLLKRIQLKERRLEPSERRLRDAEANLEGREEEIKRLKALLEEQRLMLDQEIREGVDRPDSGTRNMISEIERVIRTEEAQLDDVRMRVRRLEGELAEQREEIEILDDLLLELIE